MVQATAITTDLINKYVDARQQAGAANGTINRELAALKKMFRLGAKATPPKVYWIPAFPRLQENDPRSGFLEDAQYEKLKQANDELWFRTALELGRTYGWRKSELLNLRVCQIDLNERTIRLEPGTTKNKKARNVTMTRTVHALLSLCVEGKKPDDHVLTRRNGKRVRNFRKTWENACADAGVPGLLFHDLRRTAARNLRRVGIAEGVIMKIAGWKTRSVFERYSIVDQSDIKDAMQKLEARAKEQEQGENGHSSGIVKGQTEEQQAVNA